MAQQQSNEMQLAEILSDLVSLRPGVCDPAAALALVSARPSASTTTTATDTAAHDEAALDQADGDADLHRARELVRLHYQVRERCKRGELSAGLAEARASVERAMG